MSRNYPNQEITFSLNHTDSNGTLVNATSVTGSYRLNNETRADFTPTNTSTGVYSIILTPEKSGTLSVEWTVIADGVTSIKPDQVKVWPSDVLGV